MVYADGNEYSGYWKDGMQDCESQMSDNGTSRIGTGTMKVRYHLLGCPRFSACLLRDCCGVFVI